MWNTLKIWWMNQRIRALNRRQNELVSQSYFIRSEIADLEIELNTWRNRLDQKLEKVNG